MNRKQRKFYLTDEVHELLRVEAERTFIPMSTILQQLIVKHLTPKPASVPRRERFTLNV